MDIEIYTNGTPLDLYKDTDIKFTFQVNDIADVKDRQANYTNAFSLPRTAHNIRIFQGLGIPSDTSGVPYKKINCSVKIGGFDIIPHGWLNITETTEKEYRANVYSGVIDFFKALENKKLSDIIGEDLEHRKTAAVVSNTEKNTAFSYLIADYNGKTDFIKDGQTYLNTDPLIPCVSVKYLWNKLHEKINFQYDLTLTENKDFADLFLTYPKPISYLEADEIYKQEEEDASKTSHTSEGYHYLYFNVQDNDFLETTAGGKGLKFKRAGKYNLKLNFEYIYTMSVNNYLSFPLGSIIHKTDFNPTDKQAEQDFKNSENIYPIQEIHTTQDIEINAKEGDILALPYWVDDIDDYIQENPFDPPPPIHSHRITFHFSARYTKPDGLNTVFEDFSATDFVKEIINLFGLTIFQERGETKYLTLKERLSANAIDWTGKYMHRQSETYVYSNYAQQNLFKFKYNDKEASYYDHYLEINNENIDATRTAFTSKTYASETENGQSTYFLEDTPIIKLFEKEPVNNPKEGEEPIKYKLLNKRFHFVYAKKVDKTISFKNFYTNEEPITTNKNIFADTSNIKWAYFLRKYYSEFSNILNSSKLHKIELNLSLIDVINLDLKKLYYFAQEQQYYLLNKLTFDKNKALGEFVRITPIREQPKTEEPEEPATFDIYWAQGNHIRVGDKADRTTTEDLTQAGALEGVYFQYKTPSSQDWEEVPNQTLRIATVELQELGTYKIRAIGLTGKYGAEEKYSNILKITKINKTQ